MVAYMLFQAGMPPQAQCQGFLARDDETCAVQRDAAVAEAGACEKGASGDNVHPDRQVRVDRPHAFFKAMAGASVSMRSSETTSLRTPSSEPASATVMAMRAAALSRACLVQGPSGMVMTIESGRLVGALLSAFASLPARYECLDRSRHPPRLSNSTFGS